MLYPFELRRHERDLARLAPAGLEPATPACMRCTPSRQSVMFKGPGNEGFAQTVSSFKDVVHSCSCRVLFRFRLLPRRFNVALGIRPKRETPVGVEPTSNCFAGSCRAVWLQRRNPRSGFSRPSPGLGRQESGFAFEANASSCADCNETSNLLLEPVQASSPGIEPGLRPSRSRVRIPHTPRTMQTNERQQAREAGSRLPNLSPDTDLLSRRPAEESNLALHSRTLPSESGTRTRHPRLQ